jgi:hypothetical protein
VRKESRAKSKISERSFRTGTVIPQLKRLLHTSYFPIQQASIKGDADFILCARGWFVWLELKRRGGEPTELQKFKANWVRQTYGITLLASPDNWEEIRAILLKLDEGEMPQWCSSNTAT